VAAASVDKHEKLETEQADPMHQANGTTREAEGWPNRPLVVWGAGGQARVIAEFAERVGFRIAAVIDGPAWSLEEGANDTEPETEPETEPDTEPDAKSTSEPAPSLERGLERDFEGGLERDSDSQRTGRVGSSSPVAGVAVERGWSGLEAAVERIRSGGESTGGAWVDGSIFFCVAIGRQEGSPRVRIQDRLKSAGLRPATLVHPTAFVATDARVGEGGQILAQAAVCAKATLGRACLVNTGASVDHDCELEAGVHVAPGVRLLGGVRVGASSLVGANAVVLPGVRIGREAVIGAGSVVTRDVGDGVVAYGQPARPRR